MRLHGSVRTESAEFGRSGRLLPRRAATCRHLPRRAARHHPQPRRQKKCVHAAAGRCVRTREPLRVFPSPTGRRAVQLSPARPPAAGPDLTMPATRQLLLSTIVVFAALVGTTPATEKPPAVYPWRAFELVVRPPV